MIDIQVSQVAFIGIAVALLGRNTAVGVLLQRAPVRRAPERHVDAQPRPRGLRAGARGQPDADDPGARPALRRRRPADPRSLWRARRLKLRRRPEALRKRPRDRLGRQAQRGGRQALPTPVDCDRRDGDLRPRVLHRPSADHTAHGPVAGRARADRALRHRRGHAGRQAAGLERRSCSRSSRWRWGSSPPRRAWGTYDVVVWSALLAATLRYATPLTFAAIGGLFSERSGVVNIGLEGMMLLGAFFGSRGADKSGLVGPRHPHRHAGRGVARARARSLLDPPALRPDRQRDGDQLPRPGSHGLRLRRHLRKRAGTPADIPQVPDVHLACSTTARLLPRANVRPAEPARLARRWRSCRLAWIVIFKTAVGLRIRAVGEHPRAADTVGISVYSTRYAAVIVSGAFAALGGVYLSLGFVHSFNENMTAGRGFIALAALIFGNWHPFGALQRRASSSASRALLRRGSPRTSKAGRPTARSSRRCPTS